MQLRHKTWRKGSGPFGDESCRAKVTMIVGVLPALGVESHRNIYGVNHSNNGTAKYMVIVLFDRGFTAFTVIENLHELEASGFGAIRDYDMRTDVHFQFGFMEDKDGPTMIMKMIFKTLQDHPFHSQSPSITRTHT